MKTFDDIRISRPALAKGYLALLTSQPGRPLALFAQRRVGKTYFLKHDLAPAAATDGFMVVYADLWLNRGSPLDAINHALEEAFDDATVPSGAMGKIAKTPVKSISGFQFGDEPKRRPLPEKPELRFDALVVRLAKVSGKRILLMLDEIQALAESPNGSTAIATIRAVLSNRSEIHAVFTGSSQEALSQMMSTIGAPMYQFSQLLTFPCLDDEFLRLLVRHYQNIHPTKKLDLDDLRKAFEYIGFKPALIKDLVKEMSAEGTVNVALALRKFVTDERQTAGWQANFEAQPALERALLVALAHSMPPMAKDTMAGLARASGEPVTIAKVRAALIRLRKAGILAKPSGAYIIEDRLLSDYIARTNVPKQRIGRT